jgi:hypothetical protein
MDVRAHLRQHGYASARAAVSPDDVRHVISLVEPLLAGDQGSKPGVRRVLQREPRLGELLRRTGVASLARQVCGEGVGIVRAIVFDKSPTANWLVPWHQDAVVAVKQRHDVIGFGPWSIKDGEPHCRPPRSVIDEVAVLRVHLDPCGPEQGPLRVIADSHLNGALVDHELRAAVEMGTSVDCVADAGDIVLMRPLTIHASSRATKPAARRRVLHLECCAVRLPTPLEWGEWTPLGD